LEAARDVQVKAAGQQQTTRTEQTDKGFYANARETTEARDGKPGSKQYAASVGYEVDRQQSTTTQDTLVASQLGGASIRIDGKGAVNLDSTDLD
uniref:hypothetical protein n=1 Tax=Salmonella sp. s54234 TaxID=3159663 RepID=UPI00397F3518